MIKYIRRLCVFTMMIMSTLINYILCKLINFGNLLGFYNKKKAVELCNKVFYPVMYYSIKIIPWIRIAYVSTNENKKIIGQNIIIANHVSYFDPYLIANIHYNCLQDYWNVRVVAYHKVFDVPFAGYVLKSIGALAIKMENTKMTEDNKYDHDSAKKLMDSCKKIINDGYNLFLFPEGKRNNDPSRINKIKLGAYNLSIETKIPVQILVHKGVHKIWSADGYPDGSGTITVTKYEDPITFTSPDEYRERVTTIMEKYISDDKFENDKNK